MKPITVFTPTYNRANLLQRLYKKMQAQTDKNFIWLIVDDGSTDNTCEVVNSLLSNTAIEIQYLYKQNGGKQSAVNAALEACQTEWFAFCDSDDWYLDNTIEKMNLMCKNIESSNTVSGIVARRGDENLQCKFFPLIKEKEMVIDLPTLYEKYKFHAETCAVFRTSSLREAKYPVIADRFIPESYMFDKYSQKYKVIFINEVWSISKYLPDGLTAQSNKLYHNNPLGVMYALIQATRTQYGFKRNVKNLISLFCWRKMYPQICTEETPLIRWECVLFAVSGYIFARLTKQPSWIWKKD